MNHITTGTKTIKRLMYVSGAGYDVDSLFFLVGMGVMGQNLKMFGLKGFFLSAILGSVIFPFGILIVNYILLGKLVELDVAIGGAIVGSVIGIVINGFVGKFRIGIIKIKDLRAKKKQQCFDKSKFIGASG